MAQETTVHRVDAEQAVGLPVAPIPPALAVDGIDEIFTVFVPAIAAGRSPGDGRTVHLHATDAEGEWLVRSDPGYVVVESGHAEGDAAVRARPPTCCCGCGAGTGSTTSTCSATGTQPRPSAR